jgi:uncharacterized cupin superfamily protein
MPRIDLAAVPVRKGSGYPTPFDAPCAARTRRRLGDAGGLRDFGVNLMTLPPGGWSTQRHWHSDEDEFVYVLEGELTLVEDDGETLLNGRAPAVRAMALGERPVMAKQFQSACHDAEPSVAADPRRRASPAYARR